MKYWKIILCVLGAAVFLGGCKPDLSKYEGSYLFVKKIDEADKSETIYKKGDNRFQKGYSISSTDVCLIATPSQLNAAGKIEEAQWGKPLKLKRTDEGVFQFKKEDGSVVLTIYFADNRMTIDEYGKDQYGNIKKESRTELKK